MGPRGFNGSEGPQGPKGDQGLKGDTGLKGDKGDQGIPGAGNLTQCTVQRSIKEGAIGGLLTIKVTEQTVCFENRNFGLLVEIPKYKGTYMAQNGIVYKDMHCFW